MEGTCEVSPKNVTTNKVERKVMEKNHRNKMKSLYSKLNSLLPTHHSDELPLTVPNQIDEAIKYIKSLEIKLKKDKEKKKRFLRISEMSASSYSTPSMSQNRNAPELKIKMMGSAVDVVLTTGLDDRSIFYEIIGIFQEERVEIINISYSTFENTIVYSLHTEIEDVVHEFGGTKLIERLRKLVYEPKNDAEMQAAPASSSDGERIFRRTDLPANFPTTTSDYHFWSH